MGEVEGFVIPASERESPLTNCCESDSSFFLYAMMLAIVVLIDGMSTFLFEQNVF